nr:hypothetical protein [Tanacetum cinerariifolium]
MGGSSSQPHTDPPRSPINAFSIEELYTPEFLKSLQENTDYWQAPNTYEAAGKQVVTSPTKNRKKATRNCQKRMIENDDAPRQTPWTTEKEVALAKGWLAVSENKKDGNAKKKQGFWCEHCWEVLKDRPKWQEIALPKFSTGSGGSKRHKSSGSSSFNTESGEASINLNTNVGDNDEDEVQEIRRPDGRDKARAAGRKNKGSKPTGSSTLNEDEMARLMVTEITALEKEERLAFLEIKRREVECREREIEQQDMRINLRRTSVTGFPAQSISSSNTVALDSPYVLVLNTGASQSRQHVNTSLIHIESRKPPTAELFDVDSGRISIRH